MSLTVTYGYEILQIRFVKKWNVGKENAW